MPYEDTQIAQPCVARTSREYRSGPGGRSGRAATAAELGVPGSCRVRAVWSRAYSLPPAPARRGGAVQGRVIVWHLKAHTAAYASLKALLRYLRVEAVEGGVIVWGRHTLTHSRLQVVVDANSRHSLPPPTYVSIRQHTSAYANIRQHTCSAAACLLANPTSRYASTCTRRTHI